MKKLLLTLCIFAFFRANSQINVMWESRYNSATSNIDRVTDMVVDASGNVYVTGSSLNASSASSGFDFVTVKYNNAGAQQWIATFNGTGNSYDNSTGIVIDAAGNVYVCGTSLRTGSDYDMAVIKYNASGVLQWQIYNGSTFYDEARSITVDGTGAPIVAGGFQPSATNTDYRTLKLNAASGATTWSVDFTSAGNNLDLAVDVTTDGSNNVYVTGHSFNAGQDLNVRTIKYNSAGTQVWNTQWNENNTLNSYDMPSDISVDGSGNVYVLATVFNGAVSDDDILILKYNSAGTVTNNVELNGSANDKDKPNSLILDPAGNIYIAGRLKSVSTAEDFLVAKYNSSVTQVWIDRYNGFSNNYDEAFDIALDPSSTFLYATGYSYFTSSNNDYTTIKYDVTSGSRVWVTQFNGPANNSDQAKAISVDGAGNVYVSGDSRGAGTNFDYSTIKYCQLKTIATVDYDSLCVGGMFTLSASGGTVSASWSPAVSLSCPTCPTTTATPSSSTCYIVTTTDVNGCMDDDTICVVINPLPGPVITPNGPTTFCIGDSVGLAASGFTSYSWNTGETSSNIVTDTSGTYTVTVTDAMGCQNFTSVAVTVNNLPTISAGVNGDHCIGDSTQLTATGGVSYLWQPNPDLTSTTIANPYSTAYIVGSYWYYVTGTDINGCKNSDSVMVTVNPTPAKPLLFRPPGDVIFVTNTGYAGGLEWFYNGASMPTAGSGATLDLADSAAIWGCQVYVISEFNAQYTDSNGCVSPLSDTMYIDTVYNSNCYIGVKELEIVSGFRLYPNPTNSNLTIEFIPTEAGDFILTIVDLTGAVIRTEILNNAASLTRKSISLDGIASGVYQLTLRDKRNLFVSERFIKQD